MKSTIGLALVAVAVFIGWLQYNTDFQTTSLVLIVMAIFGGIVIAFLMFLAIQRSSNDAIIRHDEAMSRIRVEELRVQRVERQSDTVVMRSATQLARQQVREMLPYHKAMIEAKYQPQEPIEDAEFRPLDYMEDDEL